MQPVWFCVWHLSGQGVVWNGCVGKTMYARKKFPTHEMFGRSSSFWCKKTKKFPPCLYGYFGWKLGWIYCFFTLKVDCAYAKHCKNSKLTEYVARPIFKHVSSIKFQRKKVITIYLTPQPRRDFLLFDWVCNRMCAPKLYIPPNNRFA